MDCEYLKDEKENCDKRQYYEKILSIHKIVCGDLTEANADLICHQVNCQGAMNSGVAKSIRNKYPKVYQEYINYVKSYENNKRDLLGKIQIVNLDKNNIVNIFAQYNYGYSGNCYTSYDAFNNAILSLKNEITSIYKGKEITVAFPYKIGCVRGGANWNIISSIIQTHLGTCCNIEYYKLD